MTGGISIGGAWRFFWRLALGLVVLIVALLLLFRIAAAFRERSEAVPATSTLVATPLGRVAVALSGPVAGTPVMLIPGTAGWSGFWRDVSRHLAGRGYRVIAVDLPPFGYSDRDPQLRYDRAAQARRLAAVLKALAPNRPAIVVAHSFGAGAATELALRAPERIGRLVLVDAALGILDPPGAPASGGLIHQPIVMQPAIAASLTNPWALPALMRSLLARKDAADPWIETIRQPMRRTGSTAAYAAWAPALFSTNDGGWSWRSDRLAAMKPPVAIIWGEADTVTPIAQGERLARILHAPLQRLPGIGHIPHIEDPAHFLPALDRAIEERP
jgi:pimeloyl-ACP methyl ester carboxylesterase